MKVAVRYGDKITVPRVKLGDGLVGYAALHKTAVNVPDVSLDPRYIKVVDDARSELVIPLMLQDRCIGVFDLESPELDAFSKSHVDILTLLASQAAVAIENARLYEKIRSNEVRLEKEIRFAQRVQAGLLPVELPKRMKSVDVAARLEPARGLGGDFYDFLAPEPSSLVVAVGDVSGKGVAAALYSAFAGELVRSRTFRRRYAPERFTPAGVLLSIEHDPLRAPARGVLLHAVLRAVRRQAAHRHHRQLGAAVSGPLQRRRRRSGGDPWRAARPVSRHRPTRRLRSISCRATSTSSAPMACTTRRTSSAASSATTAAGVVAATRQKFGARDRRRDLQCGQNVPRRHDAERRHDRGRGKDYQ